MDEGLKNAALALLRALVEEIKSSAHDPATIHLVAGKLHHGIDELEKMLVGQPSQEKPPPPEPSVPFKRS